MAQRPDYGLDSPHMVAGELVLGMAGLIAAALLWLLHASRLLRIAAGVVGAYFALNALGMIRYSRRGKLRIREQALDLVHWCGDEQVLDIGCGRGLLLVGAAHRLTSGHAVGIDRWIKGALSGNSGEAALQNAALEGVADRVAVTQGDARELPFDAETFDVVVSNFAVHEMDTRADREQMLREIVRVLRPGGQVVLVDFIFTAEATRLLQDAGMRGVRRVRLGSAFDWIATLLLSFGLVRVYAVTGRKAGRTE